MTELKARSGSVLESFRSSVLKAFGGIREPELFEREFASSFRVAIEIDKVEIYQFDINLPAPFLGSLLSTIAGGSITTVVWNRGLRTFQRWGLFEYDDVSGSPVFALGTALTENNLFPGTFAVARNDVMENEDPSPGFANIAPQEENGRWKTIPIGSSSTSPPTRELLSNGAQLAFDTKAKALKLGPFGVNWGTGHNPGPSILHGHVMPAIFGFPDGVNIGCVGWHWDPSENNLPIISFPPGSGEDGHMYLSYGRLIFESL